MDRAFSFLLWPKREARGPWKQGRKKRGSITCPTDRANEANKMFIIWLCWLFRFLKGDRELEVRTATYGPATDQSQHAKSVSHIIKEINKRGVKISCGGLQKSRKINARNKKRLHTKYCFYFCNNFISLKERKLKSGSFANSNKLFPIWLTIFQLHLTVSEVHKKPRSRLLCRGSFWTNYLLIFNLCKFEVVQMYKTRYKPEQNDVKAAWDFKKYLI